MEKNVPECQNTKPSSFCNGSINLKHLPSMFAAKKDQLQPPDPWPGQLQVSSRFVCICVCVIAVVVVTVVIVDGVVVNVVLLHLICIYLILSFIYTLLVVIVQIMPFVFLSFYMY